jgi:succinate dehydrogenase/fumarate reductase flavoprotein subunit
MEDRVYECDVLVAGSGASGMAAAVTAAAQGLKVLVVEKEPLFGGSTARSGGWLWIPGSRLAKDQGLDEPPGMAKEFLRSELGSHFDEDRVDSFLANGPKSIDFFTRNTCVQFDMPMFPDYHAEVPGGQRIGGRSMVTRPFDARELGKRHKELAPPLRETTVFGMTLGSGKEVWHFLRVLESFESFRYVIKRFARHFRDVLLHGRGMTLTSGNALAGRLAKAAIDRDVAMWLSTPLQNLVLENGTVVGAVVEHQGRRIRIHSRRGVVLACGGFSHDVGRRQQLYPHLAIGGGHFSPAGPGNTGDGLRAAEAVGGWVDTSVANAAAWTPVSLVPRAKTTGIMPHFIDRAKPGIIAVGPTGHRFANEASDYHQFVQAMVKECSRSSEVYAWLICDHRALRKYGMGAVRPKPLPIGSFLRSGYLKRAYTLEELAAAIDIVPMILRQTVDSYNTGARHGEDASFGKGSTVYNRYMGDALNKPNPCVAPLESGPFYAIRLVVGDIGTFAGLNVDGDSRVLDGERRPIPGLYAVGNDAASVMGGNYPGAGITLGPALTFGYAAGMHLAGSRGPERFDAAPPAHRASEHDPRERYGPREPAVSSTLDDPSTQ